MKPSTLWMFAASALAPSYPAMAEITSLNDVKRDVRVFCNEQITEQSPAKFTFTRFGVYENNGVTVCGIVSGTNWRHGFVYMRSSVGTRCIIDMDTMAVFATTAARLCPSVMP